MNYVAVITTSMGINMLSFILMSNHTHFLTEGEREEAERFINEFKRVYSMYLCSKYGVKEPLREVGAYIEEVSAETLVTKIAYIQMNCVAANICINPWEYKWGSGNSFFRMDESKGIRAGAMSIRKQRRISRSRKRLRPDLLVDEEEYILPESYVCVRFVEKLYGTPKNYNYHLSRSSKAKKVVNNESDAPVFTDQNIRAIIPNLCFTLFRDRSVAELNDEQLSELFKQIRYRFSSNVHQIARVMEVPYERVAALLDR